jgi:hypothetical protein
LPVPVIIGIVVVVVVLAIAGALVVREAIRMREQPPTAIFDPDDAYQWVFANLPELPASTLTPKDVRKILEAQTAFLTERGVPEGGSGLYAGAVLFDTAETIDAIVARCAERGDEYLPEQVEAVVDCQIDYLRYIGALDPAPPDEDSSPK